MLIDSLFVAVKNRLGEGIFYSLKLTKIYKINKKDANLFTKFIFYYKKTIKIAFSYLNNKTNYYIIKSNYIKILRSTVVINLCTSFVLNYSFETNFRFTEYKKITYGRYL